MGRARRTFLRSIRLLALAPILLAVILLAALASSVRAEAPEANLPTESNVYVPLEYSGLTPPIGTNFVEGESDIPWSLNARHGLRQACAGYFCQQGLTVHIATKPALGVDGHTLSDLYEVGSLALSESSTNPGVYRSGGYPGGVSNRLPSGTYYWQMEAESEETVVKQKCYEALGNPCLAKIPESHTTRYKYQTPIYSFVITPRTTLNPKPTPLTPTYAPTCEKGFESATIGGKHRCLRRGESCVWRYRRQYRPYRFACVKEGRAFRLVRR